MIKFVKQNTLLGAEFQVLIVRAHVSEDRWEISMSFLVN